MNEITLPWPPSALSPNARVHWSKKSKAAKLYREACFNLTKQAIASGFTIPKSEKLSLWIDFYPPDRRKRDDDNCISSFKSGRDGLAQALGIDDSKFRSHPYIEERIGGFIKVRITTTPTKPDQ
jgi:crossover junction endodeoxyribonuclease RusA